MKYFDDYTKGYLTGVLLGVATLALVILMSLGMKSACAQTSWDNSPYNWKNSDQNYNNSSQNWNNSPSNWNNSPYNFNSNNGVYDNSGNRVGYETISPSGTKNYYDNNGNRQGYTNGR
jgi:hypothetical protein